MNRIPHMLPVAAAIALAGAVFTGSSSPAMACPSAPLLGSVCWLGNNYCPVDYLPADGRLLPISGNEALYSLYGNTYGGDGHSNFALPNLTARSAVAVGQGPVTAIALGQTRGNETVSLSQAQLPTHTHVATVNVTGGAITVTPALKVAGDIANSTSQTPSPTTPVLSGAVGNGRVAATMWSATLTNQANVSGLNVALAPATPTVGTIVNQPAGAGQPVSILPPQLGLTACVATMGIYPPRP